MIFNLLKSKPILKELIPKGFVDIHSHILPAIDDGPKNAKKSLELISEMRKLGFVKIIGTPHIFKGLYDNDVNSIKKSYNSIIKKLKKDHEISYGAEYMLDDSILYKSKHEKLLCIDKNYLLIEMSFIAPPINLYELIFEIKINGLVPILAHPERYFYLHNNFKEYHKLKKSGCKFQLNLLSLIGYYGKDCLKIADRLIEENLIDYTGSDIHSMNHINLINGFTKNKSISLVKSKKIKEIELIMQNNQFFS